MPSTSPAWLMGVFVLHVRPTSASVQWRIVAESLRSHMMHRSLMLHQVMISCESSAAAVGWADQLFRMWLMKFAYVPLHIARQVDELALQHSAADRARHAAFSGFRSWRALIRVQWCQTRTELHWLRKRHVPQVDCRIWLKECIAGPGSPRHCKQGQPFLGSGERTDLAQPIQPCRPKSLWKSWTSACPSMRTVGGIRLLVIGLAPGRSSSGPYLSYSYQIYREPPELGQIDFDGNHQRPRLQEAPCGARESPLCSSANTAHDQAFPMVDACIRGHRVALRCRQICDTWTDSLQSPTRKP